MESVLEELRSGFHERFSLNFQALGNAGVAKIAAVLADNQTLTSLSLMGNCISSIGVTAIAKSLASNSTLETLNLADNHICDAGASAVAELLRADECALKTLYLSGNRITDAGMDCMTAALDANSSVKTVYVSGNPMSAEVVRRVGIALKPRMVLMCTAVFGGDGVDISCLSLGGTMVAALTLPASASMGDVHDVLSAKDGLAGRNLDLLCGAGRRVSVHERSLALVEAFELHNFLDAIPAMQTRRPPRMPPSRTGDM